MAERSRHLTQLENSKQGNRPMKKTLAISMIVAASFASISAASAGYYGETSIYAPTNSVGQSGAFADH